MNTDDSSYLQEVGTEHIFQKIKSILTKETIGLGNVENKSSETILSELTSSNVTTALGFTPVSPSEAVTKDSSGNITATDFITTSGVKLSDINTKLAKIGYAVKSTQVTIPSRTQVYNSEPIMGFAYYSAPSSALGICASATVYDSARNAYTFAGYYTHTYTNWFGINSYSGSGAYQYTPAVFTTATLYYLEAI